MGRVPISVGATVEVAEIESLAKGALIVGDGSGAPALVGVGANNTILQADSAQSAGVGWTSTPTFAGLTMNGDVTIADGILIKAANGGGTLDLRNAGINAAVALSGDTVNFTTGWLYADGNVANIGFSLPANASQNSADIFITANKIELRSETTAGVFATRIEVLENKIGFFTATPVVKPISTSDLKDSLINLGLITGGGATPLDLDNGVLTNVGAAGNDWTQNTLALSGGTANQLLSAKTTGTAGIAELRLISPASSTSTAALRVVFREGIGDGSANNMEYLFGYDASNNRLRLLSRDADGASLDADIWRIPDGQTTIDANTTWDDNIFDKYDDVALIAASISPAAKAYDFGKGIMKRGRDVLIAVGVLREYEDGWIGYSDQRMAALFAGGIYQNREYIVSVEERLDQAAEDLMSVVQVLSPKQRAKLTPHIQSRMLALQADSGTV